MANLKRESLYKILDNLPLETISLAFKVAAANAESTSHHSPIPFSLVNKLKQENTKNNIIIYSEKIELLAHL